MWVISQDRSIVVDADNFKIYKDKNDKSNKTIKIFTVKEEVVYDLAIYTSENVARSVLHEISCKACKQQINPYQFPGDRSAKELIGKMDFIQYDVIDKESD